MTIFSCLRFVCTESPRSFNTLRQGRNFVENAVSTAFCHPPSTSLQFIENLIVLMGTKPAIQAGCRKSFCRLLVNRARHPESWAIQRCFVDCAQGVRARKSCFDIMTNPGRSHKSTVVFSTSATRTLKAMLEPKAQRVGQIPLQRRNRNFQALINVGYRDRIHSGELDLPSPLTRRADNQRLGGRCLAA